MPHNLTYKKVYKNGWCKIGSKCLNFDKRTEAIYKHCGEEKMN